MKCDTDYKASVDSYTGLIGGVGVEHRLSDNLSMSFEYLAFDFQDEEAKFIDEDGYTRFDISGSTISIGLNYYFN